MKKFRVAIIGCGKIFPMHAVSLVHQKNVELVAVCDIKEELAHKTAKEYNCSWYVDYKKMIDEQSLDSIHLCTPHYLHPEMALYAMEHDVHVLTEKPMAISLDDAQAMLACSKRTGKELMVSFQNRFNPGTVLIRKTMQEGELGKTLCARVVVTWNRSDEYYSKSDWKGTWDKEGGGVIIDQAIHSLDLLNHLIGSPLGYVDASWHNRSHDIIQVDDCAEGLIVYRNGVKACFFVVNYYGYDAPVELEIVCENGIARLVGEKGTITFNDGRVLQADRNPLEFFEFGSVKQYWGVGHMTEINHFYQSLEKRSPIKNSAEDTMETQKLVWGIYESGRTGKPVFFE